LAELNLTDELRLGPLHIGIGPRHGDEGRGVAADALERRHDPAASWMLHPVPTLPAYYHSSPKVVVVLLTSSLLADFINMRDIKLLHRITLFGFAKDKRRFNPWTRS